MKPTIDTKTVVTRQKGKRLTQRKHPEAALQRAVAKYLDVALPKNCWWTAFPAGGGGKIRGAQLKAMGLKAGVPDILILVGDWPEVFWLELKSQGGKLSREQANVFDALEKIGCCVATARSLEDVYDALTGLGLKLRARP